jgi:hypothetical protein
VSRADDETRALDHFSRTHSFSLGYRTSALTNLIAEVRAETFEACAAHLVMRAEQSVPDLVGRISADVLRAGANEIRMLAREAAK